MDSDWFYCPLCKNSVRNDTKSATKKHLKAYHVKHNEISETQVDLILGKLVKGRREAHCDPKKYLESLGAKSPDKKIKGGKKGQNPAQDIINFQEKNQAPNKSHRAIIRSPLKSTESIEKAQSLPKIRIDASPPRAVKRKIIEAVEKGSARRHTDSTKEQEENTRGSKRARVERPANLSIDMESFGLENFEGETLNNPDTQINGVGNLNELLGLVEDDDDKSPKSTVDLPRKPQKIFFEIFDLKPTE